MPIISSVSIISANDVGVDIWDEKVLEICVPAKGQRSDLVGAAPHNPSRNKTPLDNGTIICFFSQNIFENPKQCRKIEDSTTRQNRIIMTLYRSPRCLCVRCRVGSDRILGNYYTFVLGILISFRSIRR